MSKFIINNEVKIPDDKKSLNYFNQGALFTTSATGDTSIYPVDEGMPYSDIFLVLKNYSINDTSIKPDITQKLNTPLEVQKMAMHNKEISAFSISYDNTGVMKVKYFNSEPTKLKSKLNVKDGSTVYIKVLNPQEKTKLFKNFNLGKDYVSNDYKYNSAPSRQKVARNWSNTYSNMDINPYYLNPGNPDKNVYNRELQDISISAAFYEGRHLCFYFFEGDRVFSVKKLGEKPLIKDVTFFGLPAKTPITGAIKINNDVFLFSKNVYYKISMVNGKYSMNSGYPKLAKDWKITGNVKAVFHQPDVGNLFIVTDSNVFTFDYSGNTSLGKYPLSLIKRNITAALSLQDKLYLITGKQYYEVGKEITKETKLKDIKNLIGQKDIERLNFCPTQTQNPPQCPPSFTGCPNVKGLCYNKEENKTYSTYFMPKYDYCEGMNNYMGGTQKHEEKEGVKMWYRGSGNLCDNRGISGVSGEARQNSCPNIEKDIPPSCPRGLIECEKVRGFCYNPKNNNMYSTYFIPEYDKCPETGEGRGSNMPQKIQGLNLWWREGGLKCTLDNKCVPKGRETEYPKCPSGTIPCGDNLGECYNPSDKKTYSTYYIPEEDFCPNNKTGGNNKPINYNGQLLWKRSDILSCDINTPECPSSSNPPECPPGTIKCVSKKGNCYDPQKQQMVSTYFLKDKDYCPSLDIGKKNGNKPYKIGGQNIWFKQKEINCNIEGGALSGYNEIKECPSSLEKCSGVKGLCYNKAENKLYSTYMLPQYDYDPKLKYGNKKGSYPITKDGTRLWYRQDGSCNLPEGFANMCPDKITEKKDESGSNCPTPLLSCDKTQYGCCPDKETVKENESGTNCPSLDRRECLLKEHGCCAGSNVEKKKECPLHYKCTDKAGNVLHYSKEVFEENNMIENKDLTCELVKDESYCVNNPENYEIGGNCSLPKKYTGSPSCGYSKRIKGAKIFGGAKCPKFNEKSAKNICDANVLGKGGNCNGGIKYINDPTYMVKDGEWEKICPGDPNCSNTLRNSYLCPPYNSFTQMATDYYKCMNGNASTYIRNRKIMENGECKECKTSSYNALIEGFCNCNNNYPIYLVLFFIIFIIILTKILI